MNDLNKRFAKLAGICWHKTRLEDNTYKCSCGSVVTANIFRYDFDRQHTNPDFSDPREVLKVMMKRADWPRFAQSIGCIVYDIRFAQSFEVESCKWTIPVDYITDETGLLCKAACEWLEGRKG
jgi:hypothetical protein